MLLPLFDNDDGPTNGDGQTVPDFVLPNVDGGNVQLSGLAEGRTAIVLVFHRGDSCSGCAAQLAEFQTGYASLQSEGADILAISLDSEENTRRMAERLGVTFPMLYDASTTIAAEYGVRDFLAGSYTTVTWIVDDRMRPFGNPAVTAEGEVLPAEVVLRAVRQGNATPTTRG